MNKWALWDRVLAGTVVLYGVMASAHAGVVDPNQPVAGTSQLELSQQWWQWALGAPAAVNPLLDTTGAFAQTNNSGPVFFVAGTIAGSSTRTFDVPAGKPIFFPLVNSIDVELPGGGCDVQCAFGFIPNVGNATNLHARLDGQNLLTSASFRQTSTAFFTINVPVDNAFGFPAPYVGTLDAVSDGYWIALEGLSPGPHTLVFGGAIPGNAAVEMTAVITVVPEPAAFSLLLAGSLVVFGRRWVCRSNRTAEGSP